jgi:hypothetical protein
MRRLKPRPIVLLPDRAFITSEELRLACGRSSYVWRKLDLPTFLEYFPPVVLGPDPIADRRWRIDDIAERMPQLVAHLAPGSWLDRFKQRQREATAAYVGLKKVQQVTA